MVQPFRPLWPRLLAVLASLAFVLVLSTCENEAAGPVRRRAALAVEAELPPAADLAGFGLTIDNIRLIVVRPPSDTVFDSTFAFGANLDSLQLTADVPLEQSPETFQVTIQMLSGSTLLFSGTQDVDLTSGQSNPPAQIPVTYAGPGQNVATLTIGPLDSVLSFGGALTFRPTARDGQGNVVTSFYVSWATSDTTIAKIDATGTLVAPATRGSVTISARTPITASQPAGVTTSTPITFVPTAAVVSVFSGCPQSGAPGTQLPQPFVVQVNAADNQGVRGVRVQFSAPSGGGSVAPTSDTTDDLGRAQTLLTLGASGGANVFQASVAGVATPALCNTTAVIATQLVFTTPPPATIVAGDPLPPIVITAQDGQGNTTTSFTGSVTLALGTHPPGAVLNDTVNAVAGFATFANLGALPVAGGYTLIASAPGLQSVVSPSFTVLPAPAAKLAFVTQPSNVATGAVMSPVQVAVQDNFGNTVTSATTAITVSLTVANGAVLGGTPTRNAASGIATFTGLTVDKAGTYTLSAAATGLTGATSGSFDVTPAGAVMNAWANGAGGAWSVAGNWSQGRVPATTDSVVIALAGAYTVTLDTTVSVAFLTFGASSGTQTLAMASRTLSVSNAVTIQSGSVATVNAGTIGGAAAATNLGRLTLGSATINTAFTNQGTLVATGTSQITASFTTLVGDSLIVQGNGTFGGAVLTTSGGSWTNNGAIVLTDIVSSYGATLTVPTGTLTNPAGRTIEAPLGTNGDRTLNATLVNQGTVTVGVAATRKLQITPPGGSASSNSATITINSGLLQVTQSGANPSFTNSGTIQLVGGNFTLGQPSGGSPGTLTTGGTLAIGSGRTFTVTGGVLAVPTGATITGTGTLALSGTTANVTPSFNTSLTGLTLLNSTWNGAGTLTNPSGTTLNLQSSTITAPFVNGGTLVATGTSQITGSFTTLVGDSLIVQGNGTFGGAVLTVSGGSWSNNGAIVLTDIVSSYGATLTVPTGTLTNPAGRTIEAPLGTNGNRTLNAALINQGTVTVGVTSAGKLQIAPPGGSASSNSATITINSGLLQVTQSGANPSFTNSGTIQLVGGDFTLGQPSGGTPGTLTTGGTLAIGSGRTFTVTGGVLAVPTGATINGTGTLALSGTTANVTPNFNTSLTGLSLLNSTWNGPGTLTNPSGKTLNLQSSTVTAPFVNGGTLLASGTSALTGTVTTGAGDSIIVQGNGTFGAAVLTVSGGSWTNSGAIVLTDIVSSYGATLTVPNGTLTNPTGATIEAPLGTNGSRTLNATLDNQGTLTVGTAAAQKLTIAPPGGGEITNSGSITVSSGTLQASMTGTNPFAANTGTITLTGGDFALTQPSGASAGLLATPGALVIGSGRTFTVTGGGFQVPLGGTITGSGTLALSGDSAAVTPDFTTGSTRLSLLNSVWLGSGILTNSSGVTLNLQNSEIAGQFLNAGTLVATGASVISAPVTTTPTSLIQVQGNGIFGGANLQVTGIGGLTNNGTIVLTDVTSSYGSTLKVPNGLLTNTAGATIQSLPGAGGQRTLNADLTNDNGGVVTVSQTLTMDQPAAGDVNNGVIQLAGGDLHIVESGFRPAVSNFGTIDVGTNKMVVTGTGTFINQSGGILRGSGTFDIATATISFITNGRTIVDGTPGGKLNWLGSFTEGPPSTLELNVAGLGANPGTDYDQLNVSDNVTIQTGASLLVTGALVPGETYIIIQVPAGKTITGDFSTVSGLGQCSSGVSGTVYVIAC